MQENRDELMVANSQSMLEAEVERLETMVRWARADSEALNIENKRYKEALEAIKKHQETMNQGDGPLKDRKLYEFTAAWNIAQKALDGDIDVK